MFRAVFRINGFPVNQYSIPNGLFKDREPKKKKKDRAVAMIAGTDVFLIFFQVARDRNGPEVSTSPPSHSDCRDFPLLSFRAQIVSRVENGGIRGILTVCGFSSEPPA
ncbi:MAG: hypothetical protein J6Y92_03750 [Lentisphaeria bacterium]|nr:hypothetical protein [Lentisphaeria bacterium]